MGNLKQTITLERRDESGVVVEKKEQLGKSFLIGFINQLYTQMSGNAHTSRRTIYGYGGATSWSDSRNIANLRTVSPDGFCAMDEIELTPKGHEIGIQVGVGTLPVSSWDRGLDNKHNPEVWRTNKCAYLTAGGQYRFTGLCTDGSYMYALIQSNPAYIYKLKMDSLEVATAWAAPGVYTSAYGLGCDGSQIWMGGAAVLSPYAKLYKMTTNGSLVATYAYSTSTYITGVTWDGKWLMVADDATSNNVHHVSPTSGAILDNLNPYGFASRYWDLSYYDNALWLLSRIISGKPYIGLTVLKVNPTTGTYLWSSGTPIQGHSSYYVYPQALCVMPDGQIWVGEYNNHISVLAAYMYCMGTGSTSNLEFGATEVRNNLVASNPNAEYSVRRYFTNASIATININEVALYVGLRGECISRDVVVPAVALPPSQVLKVEYVLAVTV